MKESDAVRSACASRAQPLLLPNNRDAWQGAPGTVPCRRLRGPWLSRRHLYGTGCWVPFPVPRAGAPLRHRRRIHFVSFNPCARKYTSPSPLLGAVFVQTQVTTAARRAPGGRAEQSSAGSNGGERAQPCQLTDEWRSMDGFREGGSNWYISTRFQPFRGPATGF